MSNQRKLNDARRSGRLDREEKDVVIGTDLADACAELIRSRTKWDEGPAIYFVYREGTGILLRNLGIRPRVLLRLDRAGDRIRAAANMIHPYAELAPENLVGAAYRDEGWLVYSHISDVAGTDQLKAAANARQIHAHPSRIECRLVSAATAPEYAPIMLMQDRGEQKVTLTGPVPGADTEKIEGDVPDAIAVLARALIEGTVPWKT